MENGLSRTDVPSLKAIISVTNMTAVGGAHGFRLGDETERPKEDAFSVPQRRHNRGCQLEEMVETGW